MKKRIKRTRETTKKQITKRHEESEEEYRKHCSELDRKGIDPTAGTNTGKPELAEPTIDQSPPPDSSQEEIQEQEPQEEEDRKWNWRKRDPDKPNSWLPEDNRLPLTCIGPRKKKCQNCEDFKKCKTGQLTYWTPIPQYIFDNMNDLSLSAQKIFLTINRLVEFDEIRKKIYYNKWRGTYEDLSRLSGIKQSNMGTYIKELTINNYITHKQNHIIDNGKHITVNEFSVRWRIDKKKLDIKYDKRGGIL